MKFSELKLNPDLLRGINNAGLSECMPVQEETFKYTFSGKDVYVQSQTGTGKTAAFLITIFHRFLDDDARRGKKALIITPTRELAVQIEKEAKLLSRFLDLEIGSFYGGVGYYQQEKLLKKDVEVMVGTPGRLLDLNRSGRLNFKQVGILVIDEADRLFDMGFLPDIRRMLGGMVPVSQRQTMLYSATLSSYTRTIAREYMNRPAKIEIKPEQVTVDTITQVLYHVATREKISLLLGIFKKEQPANALIFTNMKHMAIEVSRRLQYHGYDCDHLIGDLAQKKRLRIIEDFKSGKLPFLVATDVAARGLHIDDLEMVVNYDLPGDCENYVHRIGRTARVGKTGKAISFGCENYVYNLEAIESLINMKIPVEIPGDELFEKDESGPVFAEEKRRKGRRPSRFSHETPGSPRRGKTPGDRGRRRTETRRERSAGPPSAGSERSRHKKTGPRKPSGPRPKEAPKAGPPPKDTPPKPGVKKAKGPKHKGVKRGKSPVIEDRLQFYREKYGEDFKVKTESPSPYPKGEGPGKRKGLFQKVRKILKK